MNMISKDVRGNRKEEKPRIFIPFLQSIYSKFLSLELFFNVFLSKQIKTGQFFYFQAMKYL